MTSADTLRQHFTDTLSLPPDATQWLLDLWLVMQVFDDVADQDNIERKDLHDAIWCALVAMPTNPFYAQHQMHLTPLLITTYGKWIASDDAERAGLADERSFVWRAGYYDVVLVVVLLVHGYAAMRDMAHQVLSLYGEKFTDYKQEFPDAGTD